MVVLTRADIINGKQKTKEFESKIINKTVLIRALTDGEYSQIDTIKKDVGKIKTDIQLDKVKKMDIDEMVDEATAKTMTVEVDPKRQSDQNFRADCLTAAYGLSVDEKWKADDLKGAPAGFAAEVAKEVLKLSKLNEPESIKEDVESFREGE